MSKITGSSLNDLERYYLQALSYLFDKYHSYPSNLLGLPVAPSEQNCIGYFDGMGRNIASGVDIDPGVSSGKLVV